MTTPTHTASEVLLQFLAESHQGLNELAGHGTAIQQALSMLEADLLAIIGGYEVLPKQTIQGIGVNVPIEPYIRNELRAELRIALSKYMGTGVVANAGSDVPPQGSGASDE